MSILKRYSITVILARSAPCFVPAILAIIFSLPSMLAAQNLLSNPSFEYGGVQCDCTIGPLYFPDNVWGWWLPTRGTTDIFSTAIPNKYCWASMPAIQNPPINPENPQIGNQLPRTGSRFIGLFSFSKAITEYTEVADTTYREYAQATLIAPLVPGEYYCAEMYVSLAETPRYAANNLGMYFHENDKWQRNWISATPQVLEKEIILNNVNWVKVSGAFKATTPARFLTIGNFFSYQDTQFVEKGGSYPQSASYNYAYYFVDDVSVMKLQPKTFVYSGATAICEGEIANIKIDGGLESIAWTTLSDTVTVLGMGDHFSVRPFTTTSYLLKGKNCGLEIKDTLTINVKPGQPLDLGGDKIICAGTSLTLDAGVGYVNYKWRDESGDRFFHVTETGTYSVSVESENGCRYSDDIQITVDDIPTVNLGNDTLLCGNFFALQPGYKPNTTYSWSTGSPSHGITPTEPGTYAVTLKNSCGEASDTITIYSPDNIFISNVVTMNNDDLNERFVIQGNLQGGDLTIYNRWGTEILQTNEYQSNWPTENEDIPSGTYYYQLAYPGCKTFNGWVQVIKN